MFALLGVSLFLPLLGFLLASTGIIPKKYAPIAASMAVLIPFLLFFIALVTDWNQTWLLYPWISLKNLQVNFQLHLDHLSLLMCLIITGIGFLIHVYSIGYMDHEKDVGRYFGCLNLFVFSMLLLVLAGDLLVLFIGWEGVGLASYLLIGFYYEKPAAAAAATKAFVVNRIGDFGFILGILLALFLFQTTDIATINLQSASINSSLIPILTLLLLCGAFAKSAQIPLHVWLPDAMEGPTPVSALIHAATMVTAGVYLIVRFHPLYLQAPQVMELIGLIGGVTALFASIAATTQTDLKRVLAYSTVSQLGLMFLACSVGAFYAAMFHLTTHAFMKALLFLSAGNVIHMMHGETQMSKMGGLYQKFPKTHLFFLIGVLSMAGVPPFAAFFSKDLILETEYFTGHYLFFGLTILASLLTGFYLMRAYFLTFLGEKNAPHQEVKEAPSIMLLPVSILAFLSMIGGFIGILGWPRPYLETFLSELGISPAEKEFTHDFWTSLETLFSVSIAVSGIALAIVLYRNYKDSLPNPINLFKKAFFFDALYEKLFVIPYALFCQAIAHLSEPDIFSRSMNLTAFSVEKAAGGLQKMQSGQIRSYAAWMIIGAFCILIVLMI